MRITLTLSAAPRSVREWSLDLPAPCDVHTALSQVDWAAGLAPEVVADLQLSIWGRKVEGRSALQDGDRIELTRALRVDPKVARRERFQRQGVRTAGLFVRRQRP
ncbi:MAG: hypothetical protein RL657_2224 [Pseudomonadota bacterium]|jgi:uncharacterized protein